MPAGDILAEPMVGAELRAEAIDEKNAAIAAIQVPSSSPGTLIRPENFPTPEDLVTLRRVPNRIPVKVFTIALIELCERFSYYGSTVVCKFSPLNLRP